MLNIFLIPYTWLRHLSMGLWCGVAGVMAWWLVLTVIVKLHLDLPPSWDGPMLMCSVSGMVAMASVVGEANLRRLSILGRLWRTALAGALATAITLFWYMLWHLLAEELIFARPVLGIEEMPEDAADPSLVSLTYRLGAFVMGGLGCGCAVLAVRKFAGAISHISGGVAAGLAAAMVWYLLGSRYIGFPPDLYYAGAGMGLAWGMVFGLLTWSIPDELYAGWIRVLTPYRYGRRIPVDAPDQLPKERFVGHFPRGLDLYLPLNEGVQELHLSVAVDGKGVYRARGLTLNPTLVKRLLESVDLRYDPTLPAPLETKLSSGDRIVLGEPGQQAELEFIMLPREER